MHWMEKVGDARGPGYRVKDPGRLGGIMWAMYEYLKACHECQYQCCVSGTLQASDLLFNEQF